jgi:hypothetical protein
MITYQPLPLGAVYSGAFFILCFIFDLFLYSAASVMRRPPGEAERYKKIE